MGLINGKTFKNGNSVAVRLPKELGIPADMPITLEKVGTAVTIRPALDPIAEKRKVMELVEALRALGPPILPVEVRDPDIFPDRSGLY